MIFSSVTKEVYEAACKFDTDWLEELKHNLNDFTSDILDHFVDENQVIHEVITDENTFFTGLLGQHANPGHTIEDMWFMVDAMDILGKKERIVQISAIAKKAMEIGWDKEHGGLMHYCGVSGGQPKEDTAGDHEEPMLKQVLSSWGDKLWWIHSEALYTMLLLYERTGDEEFLLWYEKVFDYTFEKFPNPDRETREWVQILTRDGKPQDKVVALPVKDPYHITRNLILIIELLYRILNQAV